MDGTSQAAHDEIVSRKLECALPQVVGKTISGIVISRGATGPVDKWHLVFSDGTSYELFSEATIHGSSAVHDRSVDQLVANVRRDRRALKVVAADR
jgi:hypothetical protein